MQTVIRVSFYILALIVIVAMFASAKEVFGQSVIPIANGPVQQTGVTSNIQSAPAEKLTELEQARIQAKLEKQKALQAEYDKNLAYVTAQFRESTEIRALLAQLEQVTKDTNTLVEKAFDDHKIDKVKFKVNIDLGEFVPAQPTAQAKQ